jgi:hypothetical protein
MQGGKNKMADDWLKYIREHVESDIRTNRNLSGVNISPLAATILDYSTGFTYFPKGEAERRLSALVINVGGIFEIPGVGKPVHLSEIAKAGIAAFRNYGELGEEIDRYSQELYSRELSDDDREKNRMAMQFIGRSL